MLAEKAVPPTSQKQRVLTIGLIQTTASENASDNLEKALTKTEEAAKKGAQIICLQELYKTRYFPQTENGNFADLAETIPGDSTRAFSLLAKKYEATIIVPVFEKQPAGKFFNSAVTIGPDGKTLGVYRKVHVPHDPLFYEKNYFKQGTSYEVYHAAHAAFSVLICYDQWFPEAARIVALRGADIIFYPTAIGTVKGYDSSDGDWHDAWKTIQRAHAIANGVHVAAVNRVGEEGELQFWGGSFVCDSFGQIIKEARSSKEEVLIAKLDLAKNKRIQEGWGFLRNRRPDTYGSLVKGNA